ncbi:hypothetical protein NPIL_660841 [Nephila pilipes]|uniref:Uncharacterized protein n=1 Tax=Nephila pilipes TaxID=299642 RepID=A0A8X6QHR9_NEPPI|nr:hypothetical protein NPIL_660841 [Nephila pilipes]
MRRVSVSSSSASRIVCSGRQWKRKRLNEASIETCRPLVHPTFQWPLSFTYYVAYNVVYELSVFGIRAAELSGE